MDDVEKGVLVVNAFGEIQMGNTFFHSMFGYRKGERNDGPIMNRLSQPPPPLSPICNNTIVIAVANGRTAGPRPCDGLGLEITGCPLPHRRPPFPPWLF